jgi:hypothetical protein
MTLVMQAFGKDAGLPRVLAVTGLLAPWDQPLTLILDDKKTQMSLDDFLAKHRNQLKTLGARYSKEDKASEKHPANWFYFSADRFDLTSLPHPVAVHFAARFDQAQASLDQLLGRSLCLLCVLRL